MAETTNKSAIATSTPYFTALFAAVLGRLAINDIITFEDAEGRFVVYDGRDVNHSGVVDPYKLKNFTELVMSSGSAVIAGNGNDTL